MDKEKILLLKYIKNNADTKIDNIEEIREKIEKVYSEDKDLYIELANYYINNNDIHKAIKCLEKYRENKGKNIDVLILLSKKYMDVKSFEKANELLEQIKINSEKKLNLKQKEEIIELLSYIKTNICNNKTNIKTFNLEQLQYDKNVVYEIFENNKNIEEIITKIKNILFIYTSNINDIFIDVLEKILEKNLLCEKVLVDFIYNKIIEKINEKNSIFYNIVTKYKDKKDYFNLIKILCGLIEFCDTNSFVIKELSFLLNKINNTDNIDKNFVVELLMFFYSNSEKVRAKNIFLNEAEILQQKTILKSKPREIDVTITLKCNLNCIMCCNNYYKNTNYEIDDYIYDFLLNNIKYLERIVWKGGEVFLYKNFPKLLKMASNNNVKQLIITNGLLLNEEIIKIFCESNVDLSVSIDAVEKELYEKIRVGGKFETLLKNINILKKYKKIYPKFSCSMSVVLTNINYRTIDDIIAFASYNCFDKLYFMKCEPTENNKYLLLNNSEIEYVKNKLVQYQKAKIKIDYDISFQILKDNKVCVYKEEKRSNDELKKDFKETVFCLLPWKKMCIEPEHKVSFDCHCNVIKIDSGNIDIWNDKNIVKYREKIIKYREKACKIFLGK